MSLAKKGGYRCEQALVFSSNVPLALLIVVPVTGTGSLKVGTAWFLFIQGQYKLVLPVTWW